MPGGAGRIWPELQCRSVTPTVRRFPSVRIEISKMRTTAALILTALAVATVDARADELDGWCAQATKASSIVICSDPELRQQVLTRNKLFDAAKQKLSSEDYAALNAEQTRWVKSYTARCGIGLDDLAPTLPIPEKVIQCYRLASRVRTADLEARVSGPSSAVPPAAPGMLSPPTAFRNDIPLEFTGGIYVVPVLINGVLPLRFNVDSGAADVSIPADVFLTLVRTGTIGKEDYIGTGKYHLADGSVVDSDRFYIRFSLGFLRWALYFLQPKPKGSSLCGSWGMTNEDDVLARLEKIGHQLDRQAKGRRVGREIGVAALFILLLVGLVTLPNILEPTAIIGIGGLTLFLLIGICITVWKGDDTRREIERRRKAGGPYYQPREIDDILTKIGAEIEAKITQRSVS
jgi:uncharacterized protein YecT (DUF1311 family)